MAATLFTIALLHWAVLLVPGFNFLLVGHLAASARRPTAMAAVAGITTGTLLWAMLAVAGIGFVFKAHPLVRQLAQVGGGAYLLRLAWKLWRSGTIEIGDAAKVQGGFGAFRVGLTTSALNPKIALFYGSAFATSFPAEPPWTLVVAAVALVYFNSLLWHTALAVTLSQRRIQGAYIRHARIVNRASATLVGAFGAKLLADVFREVRASGPDA